MSDSSRPSPTLGSSLGTRRACCQPPGRSSAVRISPRIGSVESGRSRGFTAPTGGLVAGPGSCLLRLRCEVSCPSSLVPSRAGTPAAEDACRRSCARQRSVSQISRRLKTPATTTSRPSAAYSRRCCGIGTRPCLSGITLLGATEERPGRLALRLALLRLLLQLDDHRPLLPRVDGQAAVEPPGEDRAVRERVRKSDGRITLPFASRECWYSPRNPSCPSRCPAPPPGAAPPPRAPGAPFHHCAPPYAPLPTRQHPSPHSPPAAPAAPRRPQPTQARSAAPKIGARDPIGRRRTPAPPRRRERTTASRPGPIPARRRQGRTEGEPCLAARRPRREARRREARARARRGGRRPRPAGAPTGTDPAG